MIRRVERPDLPPGPYLVAGVGVAGAGAAEALAERAGAEAVSVWARAVAKPFASEVEALRARGVTVRLGGDGVDLLESRPTVVKSPGIPAGEPLVARAAEMGLTVLDEAEVGWRLDPRPWVGVTGTNGKSTACSLIAAALTVAGRKALVGGNTEGGPALTALARKEGELVVAELSSFQLEESPCLLPEVAVLTNCTQDSWHRHGGRAGYERAKSRIALRGEKTAPRSVLPADDPLGQRLSGDVRAAGGSVTTFGTDAHADVRLVSCEWTLERAELQLTVAGSPVRLATRLPGEHNALNVAASLAAAMAAEVDLDTAIGAIEEAAPVAGRLEQISIGGPDVVVDYAHNPDGIARVLATVRHVLRQRGRGRLIAVASALPVFNDPQYEAMGRVLAEGSDRVYATTERLAPEAPLEEPPAFFAALRAAGADMAVEIDRASAITRAVVEAAVDDVVLVLGRGRRRTPIFGLDGNASQPDDREAARQAVLGRGG